MFRHFSFKFRLAGLCLLLVLVLTSWLFQSGQSAHAKGAWIMLSPNAGLPTSTVKVKGTQFGSQETVSLSFDSTPVGNATTSSKGAFSTTITIPQAARTGFHKVTARGQSSGLVASARFQVLAVDWPTFGFDTNHSHFNPYENQLNSSNVSNLAKAWSFLGTSNFYIAPAVVDGVVYATDTISLYAIDAATGTRLWKTSGINGYQSSPAVANGVVYISEATNNLVAIDAATGAKLWTYDVGRFLSASPVVANGLVYIGSFGDEEPFDAIDAVTGKTRWTYPMSSVFSSPAVANGIVYVADGNGIVYALDAANGSERWTFQAQQNIASSPTVVNGVVYIGSDDGNVYALDAATGAKLWSYQTGGDVKSSPAVANGIVYISSDQLYALDVATGSKLWSFPVAYNYGADTTPVVANGVVYVSSDRLYALNATNGTQLWNYALGGEASPVVVNGTVYIGGSNSHNHHEYALRLPTTVPAVHP
ncbi:MAG TPA: PQQ-binding-like beta-propeller repeat protein [Ktedonobacteraceae bacterium]|nr:PQQ-binding-like beta-propeller repeat protein [Ktedonobacteraceae bacterium]